MKKLCSLAAASLIACAAFAQLNSPNADGYQARGILMYEQHNFIGCIDQMKQLKESALSPSETETADFYLAMSSAHLGKVDAPALLNYFIKQYPASPRIPEAKLAIADLLMDGGQYGEAITAYNDVDPETLDRDTRDTRAFNLGFCLLKRADYARAAKLYESLSASKKYGNDARFYQGYIAYTQKDYRKATDLFKGVSQSAAPANMADYYLAQIYYLDGDYGKAATTARRMLDRDVAPAFKTEAARVAGESLYHLGDDAQAIPLLEQYVAAVDSPLPSSLYILGVADYRQGKYDEAIERLSPVASLDSSIGQSANLFIGQAFMQQKNYSPAMIAFEKALKMDFDPAVRETAYYNYAVAGTQGGKIPFGSTVTTFEEFLRLYPDSRYAERIREYLVDGYMTDNNYPAALASIEAIRNPSPKVLAAKQQVLYTLGSRQLAAGNASSAVDYLKRARQLSSHNPLVGAETDLWLGEALYAQGSYADAAKSYLAYIANPNGSKDNHAIAVYDLAYARFSDARYNDAATDFSRFIENPGTSSSQIVADAYNRLGDCYYYNSDFTRASEAYSKSFTISPENGDYALFQEALMKGLRRDHQGKIDGMRAMIQRFPTSGLIPSALIEIGESYDQLKQPDQTIETYSMVVSRYPSTKQGRQASLLLALAYLNNDNRSQAIETYKSLISRAPTSEEATTAADNLKLLMADEGRINEYAKFIESVPGTTTIEPSELDRLAFAAAERDYLANGTTGRLVEYLNNFPEGASRPAALHYAMAGALTTGNRNAVIKYASEIIEAYPDSEYISEALKARADAEYANGRGELALALYSRLAETASNPYEVNEARLGMLRTARDLGRNNDVIDIAEALTASSTLSDAQRSEAVFTGGLAYADLGDLKAATDRWNTLTGDLKDIFGTKAAFYIAETQFNAGDLKNARKSVEKLVNSDTPYDYWYARGIILLSDINRAEGKTYEADLYLTNLRDKYPGSENDIFILIDQRLNK